MILSGASAKEPKNTDILPAVAPAIEPLHDRPLVDSEEDESANPILSFEIDEVFIPPAECVRRSRFNIVHTPVRSGSITSSLLGLFSRKTAAAPTEEPEDTIDKSSHAIFPVNDSLVVNRGRQSTHLMKEIDSPERCLLEAIGSSIMRLLAPGKAAISRAAYDENGKFTAIVTERIPFTSLRNDPLRESHLEIDALNQQRLTLEELIKIHRTITKDISSLSKTDMLTCEIPMKAADGSPYLKTVSISAKDLENIRVCGGLGVGLSASYVHEEGDLHGKNFNKYGTRVDFADLINKVTYHYHKRSWFERVLDPREPTGDTLAVTANNIRCFPNLIDGTLPGYWPTMPRSTLQEIAHAINSGYTAVAKQTSLLPKAPPISQNGFSPEECEVFKKLSKNPVFEFYKYKTFLQFILTDGDIYKNITLLHLPDYPPSKDPEAAHFKDTIMHDIEKNRVDRLTLFREVLTNMPEFHEFLTYYGDLAMEEIAHDFNAYNEDYRLLAESSPTHRAVYELQHINIEDTRKRYLEICAQTKVNIQNAAAEAATQAEQAAANGTIALEDFDEFLAEALATSSPSPSM